LFAALSLTMIVGLLIAGAIATTRLAQRSAVVERTDVALSLDAEEALSVVLAKLHTLGLDSTPLGKRVSVAVPDGNTVATANVSVTRLPWGVVWLVSDVSATAPVAGHRRQNLVARFPSILRRTSGAIVARGNVELSSDVSITTDTISEPDCEDPGGAVVALAPGAKGTLPDTASIAVSAEANDSATYLLTAFQLAALQHSGRFVHALGDTTIGGGAFDGVLVVEGSLTITGPFIATGLIVARGPIVATGGVSIVGSVRSFAEQSIGKLAIKFSGASIRYSRCAVERALRLALDARPVVQRSWAEIF
jgi:hypothetical protein